MNVKITVTYDGTDFCGWQIQPNGRSVQQILEEAVEKVTGEKVKITGSGRTDSGVHAMGQTASFRLEKNFPVERLYLALNAFLPPDVKVTASETAPDTFNACRSAKKKTYIYRFYKSKAELPLLERYAYRINPDVNVDKMREVAEVYKGEHDFKCFKASGSSALTTVRTIYDINIKENGIETTLSVTGNGFLYNMVRILAGTLLKAAEGKFDVNDALESLSTGKRELCGTTLPAKGLCLYSVEYE